jgi:hypothetical protein
MKNESTSGRVRASTEIGWGVTMPLDSLFLPFELKDLDDCLAHSVPADCVVVQEPAHKYKKHNYSESVQFCEEYRGARHEKRATLATPLKSIKKKLQAEKDEKIWTAGCLMRWILGMPQNSQLKASPSQWSELMQRAFADFPPLKGLDKWECCFEGRLSLLLEAPMPSPADYTNVWLPKNLAARNVVRYVVDAGTGRKGLEGTSQADAVIINEDNHFGIVLEAKVTADASCEISFDMMRNQIARMIDVMLELPHSTTSVGALSKRDPNRSVFVLLTPRLLKEHWQSRLYGFLMHDYASLERGPDALKRDLPHRASQKDIDWSCLPKRIGWLTWEDFD